MENLAALITFARVVEKGSFSAAAVRLGVSKATVSKEIARLEDELGVRLLHRSTRRVALTDVGTALYERCARIAAEVEEAERIASTLQEQPRGTLRVTCSMSFAHRWLSPRLPRFLATYPDVEVDLICSEQIVDLVEQRFDVALRITRLADSSLIARRLGPSRRRVLASPAYLARKGRPAAPPDLAQHQCLLYSYELSGPDSWRVGEHTVPVRAVLRSNSGEVLREAAVNGLGLVVLPDFIASDDLVNGTLVDVFPDIVDAAASVWAVYPHARHVPTKVRAFVDFLAEEAATSVRTLA